jgi:hypothetical protein
LIAATAELVVPFTPVPAPLKSRLPLDPTFPPLVLALLGGLVGGFSVEELKL